MFDMVVCNMDCVDFLYKREPVQRTRSYVRFCDNKEELYDCLRWSYASKFQMEGFYFGYYAIRFFSKHFYSLYLIYGIHFQNFPDMNRSL